MALGQTAGCPRVNRAKKFMCSLRNTGNISFSLWLTGGLSHVVPTFKKFMCSKFMCLFLALLLQEKRPCFKPLSNESGSVLSLLISVRQPKLHDSICPRQCCAEAMACSGLLTCQYLVKGLHLQGKFRPSPSHGNETLRSFPFRKVSDLTP